MTKSLLYTSRNSPIALSWAACRDCGALWMSLRLIHVHAPKNHPMPLHPPAASSPSRQRKSPTVLPSSVPARCCQQQNLQVWTVKHPKHGQITKKSHAFTRPAQWQNRTLKRHASVPSMIRSVFNPPHQPNLLLRCLQPGLAFQRYLPALLSPKRGVQSSSWRKVKPGSR